MNVLGHAPSTSYLKIHGLEILVGSGALGCRV